MMVHWAVQSLRWHYSLCYFVHKHLNNAWYNKAHSIIWKPYLAIIRSNAGIKFIIKEFYHCKNCQQIKEGKKHNSLQMMYAYLEPKWKEQVKLKVFTMSLYWFKVKPRRLF